MIPIYTTYIHENAKKFVSEVLETTFISEGKRVAEFESRLNKELGIINPIALNSGTTALHLALVLAGIGEGDEVIVPAQTFVATALVVVQQGAIPVFADIDYLTGNIDPKSIRSCITEKTKAIIPVHWGGLPCDMDEISELAREFGLIVIEDAAHAPAASYKGQMIGSISDYTCFSFQAIKHITTGDGGALSCKFQEKAREAMTRRWFGIDRANAKPSLLGERSYDIEILGFKYHLNDLGASLGLANLSDFKERLSHLRSIAAFYRAELSNIPGITLWNCPEDRQSSWWLFGIHVENRNAFIKALADKGITASVVHQRIDRNSIFGGIREHLINQAKFDETQVHIPIHAFIDMEKANYVTDTIKKGW